MIKRCFFTVTLIAGFALGAVYANNAMDAEELIFECELEQQVGESIYSVYIPPIYLPPVEEGKPPKK